MLFVKIINLGLFIVMICLICLMVGFFIVLVVGLLGFMIKIVLMDGFFSLLIFLFEY